MSLIKHGVLRRWQQHTAIVWHDIISGICSGVLLGWSIEYVLALGYWIWICEVWMYLDLVCLGYCTTCIPRKLDNETEKIV